MNIETNPQAEVERPRRSYLLKSLVHAAEVLRAFRDTGEALRLRDVVARTGLTKALCFRVLYSLHWCGFLEKAGDSCYRLTPGPRPEKRFRIGYAGQGQDSSFPREVATGLERASREMRVELVMVDNRYDLKTALRNADRLIREEVDLVIEFQAHESAAPEIARKYMEAGIPLIAVDIPHPGATYFGANNYEAGLLGGRHLGRWANKNWAGEADEVVLLELARSGSIPQARLKGMLMGLHEVMRRPETLKPVHLDGDGQFQTSWEVMRRHLRTTRAHRILVGAATDPSAIGALRAFEEAGRLAECAVIGQNAEPEGRAELRQARTRLVGTVAYFPEKYGEGLLALALDILNKRVTPPAKFIKHVLITRDNVDHFYPNDALIEASGMGQS